MRFARNGLLALGWERLGRLNLRRRERTVEREAVR
jgi:hypothetical protein